MQRTIAEKISCTGIGLHSGEPVQLTLHPARADRYYRDDIWLTDGYGDYVRHYLRAMAAAPELAPSDQNHLLRTSSVVRSIEYGSDAVVYEKWDAASRERLKLGAWEPGSVEGGTMTWEAATRVLEVSSTAKRVVIRRK